MVALRRLLLVALLGCFAAVTLNGRWEGHLIHANHIWIVDLPRSPLWAPPQAPTYGQFEDTFKDSKSFPEENDPGQSIQRVLKLDWMAFDFLLYLWAVTVIGGLVYLACRRARRDLILHLGMSAGVGLTIAAAASFALWLLVGGWGPPGPEFFGGLGLVAGILVGLVLFRRAKGCRTSA
jgi:hypothetical protein